ncbi:hypothetical protein [Mesobacillus foraminis]|uniref:hypothetical protein n=1 Tax=Mesobacillus foraminis TaxID=279826 RepID=UPI000EF4B5FD|nr:hypothetical protein [Mesobacillus foraminis]
MPVNVVVACGHEKSNNADENSSNEATTPQRDTSSTDVVSFDEERDNRLEQVILLFGEGAKGGYHLTTVNNAMVDKKTT